MLLNRRPFEDYIDQPDTAERARLEVQRIAFALPEMLRATSKAPPVVFQPEKEDQK